MPNRLTNLLAVLLLSLVLLITVSSMKNDSLTMDELAHLPAGYSYLTQKDMRLNPEHPPLVKDFSAVPLLFFGGVNFPSDSVAWKTDVNGQWNFGNQFLFKYGNPAFDMIFWARIPMILLLLVAGFYIFKWTRELFGNKAGLLALFIFSFCPTFLAHGRLVTTDVGAAVGVLIASYYYFKFLKDSTRKNLIIAGVALGIAELLKFSLILLPPFFGIALLIWCFAKSKSIRDFFKNLAKYVGTTVLIGIIGLAVIYSVYLYHVWNYPVEKQVSDSTFILASFNNRLVADSVIYMAGNPVLRPLAQYGLGILMIFQRASGGNTGYFMGEISAAGWKDYFPTVYFMKETLPFQIMGIIGMLFSLLYFRRASWQNPINTALKWIRFHFIELSMMIFVGIYWYTSLSSNLNIGVRHLLPIFPFTIILTAGGVYGWMKVGSPNYKKVKLATLIVLLLWQAETVMAVYPHFLSYFNEAVGGPSRGYKYVTDSNLDWGQELSRLNDWLNKNNIDKIYVDYFGGSDTNYYLRTKFLPWTGSQTKEDMTESRYLAVSATFLQSGRGRPAPGFDQPTGFYNWLNAYTPVTVIGNSIFVYEIK